MTRDKVFISYSHRDKRWLTRLQKMLKPLVRRGTMSLWADTEIRAGADWREEIEGALASARVAVLLVSADFLASDFIVEEELPPLLRAAEEEGMTILWLYLSPCHYEETPIGRYQATHDVAESLLELTFPKRQRTLLEISGKIKEAVGKPLPALGSVALETLIQRQEVLPLPVRGDGIARMLSLHLGPTTVVGRCYATQLHETARKALGALGEDRVHWAVAWDDDRLNQIFARLSYRMVHGDIWIEVHNVTDYSSRPQAFSARTEADSERQVQPGEKVELSLKPGIALTFTTGLGSGRQQLVRLTGQTISYGASKLQTFQTATTFLFPPKGGDDATLVRYLGGWIPIGVEELTSLLIDGAEPLNLRFPEDSLGLSFESLGGRLRVKSSSLNLVELFEAAGECAADATCRRD